MNSIEPENENENNSNNDNQKDTPMFGNPKKKKSNSADDFLRQLGEVLGIDPNDITVVGGSGSTAQVEQGGRMHMRDFSEDEIEAAREDLRQMQADHEKAIEAKRAEVQQVEKKIVDGHEVTDLTTENWETGIVTSLGTVPISTPNFKTTAFGLYDLPGEQVMEAMSAPENQKMVSFMKLLKSAILEPGKLQELELLSFIELTDVLGDWMEQSTHAAISRQGHHGRQGPGFGA